MVEEFRGLAKFHGFKLGDFLKTAKSAYIFATVWCGTIIYFGKVLIIIVNFDKVLFPRSIFSKSLLKPDSRNVFSQMGNFTITSNI